MKTISRLLILSAFVLLNIRSYAGNNNLVIFAQDGNRFTVILNGLTQNAEPETNVKITGLNAANYKVRVIFDNSSLGEINQTCYLMENGNEVSNREFTYSIEQKKNGEWKLKPNSVADINSSPTTSPNQSVYVFNPTGTATPAASQTTTVTTTTTTTGQTQTVTTGVSNGTSPAPAPAPAANGTKGGTGATTQQTTTTTTTGNPNAANVGVNAGGVGINISISDGMTGTSSSSTTTTTTQTSSTSTQSEPEENTEDKCYWPMTSTEFANAKASVVNQSFEDGKLKVAKQILSTNCMSVAQVKEIMALFSFEDTKLDWAKFAYGKTTDPQNYYQLNDGFTYSSSVDALNSYIESQKK